jgi:N-acetylglucosamine-6-sulfatase
VRYPPLVESGSRIAALVSSIDIAPTILQLGEAPIGSHVQGASFLSLLAGSKAGSAARSSVLIENFSDDRPFPWVLDADYKAIRTDRHKLIHWVQHPELDELYDLGTDPREERNVLNDAGHRDLAARLRADLGRLVQQSIGL